MNKLPEKILLMTLNPVYNFEYKNVLDILKEFFEEFPCIVTTLDDGKDYYIFPDSEIIKSTLNSIYNALDINLYIDAFRYDTYVYDTVHPRIWDTYTIIWYCDELPEHITIFDPSHIEKLKIFLED